MKKLKTFIFAALLGTALAASSALAADKDKSDEKSSTGAAPQEPSLEGSVVNVDQIKEKYWARGEESEMGVVQNRAYSKKGRFELGAIAGTINSDPFLNTISLGAHLGYHFSEYISFSLIGFKELVSNSDAVAKFQQNGGAVNTNPANYYVGGELAGSVLYGKLSVLGKSIIYYDLHLLTGAGMTNTFSGSYITPHAGLGQRFFLSKHLSLRLDYRIMYYNEILLNTIVAPLAPAYGSVIGSRSNWSHTINIGVNYFFEVFKK